MLDGMWGFPKLRTWVRELRASNKTAAWCSGAAPQTTDIWLDGSRLIMIDPDESPFHRELVTRTRAKQTYRVSGLVHRWEVLPAGVP